MKMGDGRTSSKLSLRKPDAEGLELLEKKIAALKILHN